MLDPRESGRPDLSVLPLTFTYKRDVIDVERLLNVTVCETLSKPAGTN